MVILFNYVVSKHLRKISYYASQITFDETSLEDLNLERAVQKKEDELDSLVNSLNHMKKDLKEAHYNLQKFSQDLSVQVENKTKDLSQPSKILST